MINSHIDASFIAQDYYQKFERQWMQENAHKYQPSQNEHTQEPLIADKPFKCGGWIAEYEKKREALFEDRRNSKVRTYKVRKPRTKKA